MRQGITSAIAHLSVIFPSSAALAWHFDVGRVHYFFGPLMWIVFAGIMVALVVLVIRWLREAGYGAMITRARAPLDILEERFAHGEIDEGEFEARRRLLDG